MDEHIVPRPQMGAVDKAMPGGSEGDGDRRGGIKRHARGYGRELPRGRNNVRGERAAGEAHDLIANRQPDHL